MRLHSLNLAFFCLFVCLFVFFLYVCFLFCLFVSIFVFYLKQNSALKFWRSICLFFIIIIILISIKTRPSNSGKLLCRNQPIRIQEIVSINQWLFTARRHPGFQIASQTCVTNEKDHFSYSCFMIFSLDVQCSTMRLIISPLEWRWLGSEKHVWTPSFNSHWKIAPGLVFASFHTTFWHVAAICNTLS